MSGKKHKATRKRMISCFAQIVQEHIPGRKIEEIASKRHISRPWGGAGFDSSHSFDPCPLLS